MKAPESARQMVVKVIRRHPNKTQAQLATLVAKAIAAADEVEMRAFEHERYMTALRSYIKTVKESLQRDSGLNLTCHGKPMGMISVQTSSGRALTLFERCSPQQYIEAVMKEQNVVAGRAQANDRRMEFVKLLLARAELMECASILDAIVAAGWQETDLALDELLEGS